MSIGRHDRKPIRVSASVTLGLVMAGIGCDEPELAHRYESPHASFVSDRQLTTEAPLVKVAESAIVAAADFLGVTPPHRRPVILVFPSREHMSQFLLDYCPEQANSAAACFEKDGEFVIATNRGVKRRTMHRNVRHELTHFVIVSAFGPPPPWLDEGLAQVLETPETPGSGSDLLRRAARRHVRDLGPDRTLSELLALTRPVALSPGQYATAWAFTAFLIEHPQGGRENIVEHLGELREGAAPAAAFKRRFGALPADFAQAWEIWLQEK